MPLYEYACRGCANVFEEIRKFDERLVAPPCPQCGGKQTVLKRSVPGFVGAGVAAGGARGGPACESGACDFGEGGGGCCGGACMH